MPDPDAGASTTATGSEMASFGALLLRMGPRIAQLQQQVLGRLDPPLGIAQYRVLGHLARGVTSMVDLRGRSTVTFSTLSETTSSLVRQGLVARERSPQDRRSVDLTLTDAGRRVLAAADDAMAELERILLDGIRSPSETELDEVFRPLATRVREVLTERQRGEDTSG